MFLNVSHGNGKAGVERREGESVPLGRCHRRNKRRSYEWGKSPGTMKNKGNEFYEEILSVCGTMEEKIFMTEVTIEGSDVEGMYSNVDISGRKE